MRWDVPQQTFRNLPDHRQRRIVDVCLEEFACHGYREASLTRIIDRLGLAKGSFYRYFASKRDLYAYLIVYAMGRTLDLFEQVFAEEVDDLLDAWVRFVLTCAEQDNADPMLGYFAYRVFRNQRDAVLGDVPRRTLARGMEVLERHVRAHQHRGLLRRDVAPQTLVFFLMQAQAGFMDHMALVHGVDYEANARRGLPLIPMPTTQLQRELDGFSAVMRTGFLGPQSARQREVEK